MAKLDEDPAKVAARRERLLDWYARNRRDLPWRRSTDPYAIWVSEIMLQQTRVGAVVERYQEFIGRFPTLVSLALAPEQEVLAMWSGLGYYPRARMLHKAAQFVAANLGGNLPVRAESCAFCRASARIRPRRWRASLTGRRWRWWMEMWSGCCAAWRAGRRAAERAAAPRCGARSRIWPGSFWIRARPGDLNQAMMELGATVCTPRNPQCVACPLRADCKTRGEHKTPKRAPMTSRVVAYALSVRTSSSAGKRRGPSTREVLLEQRPAQLTVMPGMWELPTLLDPEFPEEELRMTLRHAIMQVNYYVRIRTVFEDDAQTMTAPAGERRWVALGEAATMALTGLTRKVLARTQLLPSAPLDSIAPSRSEPVA